MQPIRLNDSDTESVDGNYGHPQQQQQHNGYDDSFGPRMPAFGGPKLSNFNADTQNNNTNAAAAAGTAPDGGKASGGLLSLLGLGSDMSQESLDKKWNDLQRNRKTKDLMVAMRALDEDESVGTSFDQSTQNTDVAPGNGGPPPGLRLPGAGLGLSLGGDSTSSADTASPTHYNPHGHGGGGGGNKNNRGGGSSVNNDFDGSYDITANGTLELRSYRIGKKGIRFGTAIPTLSQADLEQTGNLGSGASGKVTRCLHKPTGLTVALKSIDITDKGKRDQLVKELEELEKENCPHLVGFYNRFFSDGLMHLALEYMDRGSLESIVAVRRRNDTNHALKHGNRNVLRHHYNE